MRIETERLVLRPWVSTIGDVRNSLSCAITAEEFDD